MKVSQAAAMGFQDQGRRSLCEISLRIRPLAEGEDVLVLDEEHVLDRLSGKDAVEVDVVADQPGQDDDQAPEHHRPQPRNTLSEPATGWAGADDPPGHQHHGQAEPDDFLARQIGQAHRDPQGQPGQDAGPRGGGRYPISDPEHSGCKHRSDEDEHSEGDVRVGDDRSQHEGAQDGREQARGDRDGASPSSVERARASALTADDPGQGRHERAEEGAPELCGSEAGPQNRHRRRRDEATHRQPQLERRFGHDQRWCGVTPHAIAHEASTVDEVSGDICVVGARFGGRERDLFGGHQADQQRQKVQPQWDQDVHG